MQFVSPEIFEYRGKIYHRDPNGDSKSTIFASTGHKKRFPTKDTFNLYLPATATAALCPGQSKTARWIWKTNLSTRS
jgi:hypothetical protein